MSEEKLKKLIENGGFTKGDYPEINSLFYRDANENCDLLTLFIDYCNARIVKDGPLVDEKIHEISYAYIANIENRQHHLEQYLHFLYNREAEYFTCLNSSNEILYYAEKILDTPSLPHIYYALGVIYILNALANAKLFDKLITYEDKIKELINDKEVGLTYHNILELSLLDCYAFGKQREEYDKAYKLINVIYNSLDDKDVTKKSLRIHMITSSFAFDGIVKSKSNEQLISEYKEVLEILKHMFEIMDCYEPLFIPMFDAISKILPAEEMINDILGFMGYTKLANNDIIAFSNYLIDKLGVTYEKYPDFYKQYFKVLRQYNTARSDVDRQSISITLLEHEMQNRYKSALNIDQLTGLYSRYAFHNEMPKFVPDENSVALVADLNHLKLINDNYGHSMGDKAIVVAAERLQKYFGMYGKVYRFGGDEFFIFANIEKEKLEDILKQIDDLSSEKFVDDMHVEISIGYAFYKDYLSEDVNYLFKAADRDMYTKKSEYYKRTGIDRRKW